MGAGVQKVNEYEDDEAFSNFVEVANRLNVDCGASNSNKEQTG